MNGSIGGSFAVTFAAISVALLEPSCLRGDDKGKAPEKIIPAAQAKDHVGEECTCEMTVRSSKNAEKRRTYFLDSEEDFHDEKNLAIVISYDHADKFRAAGIDDPAEHYKDKTIRVTGKIIHEDDQVRIRVEDPKQIKIVESKLTRRGEPNAQKPRLHADRAFGRDRDHRGADPRLVAGSPGGEALSTDSD